MRKHLSFFALLAIIFGLAQEKQQVQVKRATVGFLNVENLWDTIPSADYIDGTLPRNNPKFQRSGKHDARPDGNYVIFRNPADIPDKKCDRCSPAEGSRET